MSLFCPASVGNVFFPYCVNGDESVSGLLGQIHCASLEHDALNPIMFCFLIVNMKIGDVLVLKL